MREICIQWSFMQRIPSWRDLKDNGVAAMLVYHKRNAKEEHGGDDVTCILGTLSRVDDDAKENGT